MEARLLSFLDRQSRVPFEWGVSDCCLFVADYLLELGANADPAEGVRGTYHDEAGAQAALDALGGMPAALDRSGWQRAVGRSLYGDIELLRNRGGVVVPAIRLDGCWYHKSGNGGCMVRTTGGTGKVWRCPRSFQ